MKTIFLCINCKSEDMTAGQMIEHLAGVHKLKREEMLGPERMVMCMDGAKGWYRRAYEIDISGIKLSKIVEKS